MLVSLSREAMGKSKTNNSEDGERKRNKTGAKREREKKGYLVIMIVE